MTQHNITRDGKPPLRFMGKQIGQGETAPDHNGNRNRWTTITIYATKGGNYILQEESETCWQGEHNTRDAQSFKTAADVIECLRMAEEECGSEGESLSEEAAEAVEEAAAANADFAAAWVVVVD